MTVKHKANTDARDDDLAVCSNHGVSPRPLRLCGETMIVGPGKEHQQ
jgi:hypothetical protein